MTRLTERPILFSAPMVRALLDGSKTQKLYAARGVDPSSPEQLADVVEIRARLGTGEVQRTIAVRYGVSQSAVSLIARGKVRCA